MTDSDIIKMFSDKRGKINPNKTRKDYLNKYIDVKQYLENRYDVFFGYTTTIKFIFAGYTELPKCKLCGKPLNSIRQYCNVKCETNDPDNRALAYRNTDFEKKVIKTKKTMKDRYGVEVGFQTDKCIQASHTKEARQKAVKSSEKTCLFKYGETNSFKVKEFYNKGMQTKLKHRPNDPNNSKKIQETISKKYGKNSILAIPEYREKGKQTKLNRYGDSNYTNREKAKKTCLDKYGSENPTAFNSTKFKKSMLDKYGAEYFCQTEEFNKTRKRKFYFDNIGFDSLFEVAFYVYHRDLGNIIKHEPCQIEYFFKNKRHIYCPDFRVNGQLIEIKGSHFFENGKMINPFDRSLDDLYEAKHQCMLENNVKIITDFSLYLKYFKEHNYQVERK